MRNAATFEDDFGYDEPRRRAAPPRKSRQTPGKGRKRKGRGFRLDTRKVVRYLAVGLSTGLVVAIALNALVLQKGRHPAPLFGKALAPGQAMPAPSVAARVAAPAPTIAAPEATIPAAVPSAPAPTKPRRTVVAAPGGTAPDGTSSDKGGSDRDDAIARLLAGQAKGPQRNGGAAAEKAQDKAGDPSQVKTVTGVQRALAKLGFNVKATGTIGPQTHKAIEAFEKDRHMPVTGEVSHRMTKVLAAESGLKLD